MMQKTMNKTTLNLLKALVVVNILGVLIIVIFFDMKLLYPFEIGFISSTLVMFASLKAYKRMVKTRVEHDIITFDDSKDVIDKLEDPYDLYSEEVTEVDEEVDLKEVVKEERKRLKEGRNLSQTLKDSKSALSVYRLGAYGVLILGFFYLNRHGLLHIWTYILALGLPTIVIVTMLVKEKETEDTLQ